MRIYKRKRRRAFPLQVPLKGTSAQTRLGRLATSVRSRSESLRRSSDKVGCVCSTRTCDCARASAARQRGSWLAHDREQEERPPRRTCLHHVSCFPPSLWDWRFHQGTRKREQDGMVTWVGDGMGECVQCSAEDVVGITPNLRVQDAGPFRFVGANRNGGSPRPEWVGAPEAPQCQASSRTIRAKYSWIRGQCHRGHSGALEVRPLGRLPSALSFLLPSPILTKAQSIRAIENK